MKSRKFALCLVHLPIPNGLVTYNLLSSIPELFHATGSVAALSCNLGFVANGSTTTKCTSKGIWEPKLGTCVLISDNSSTTLTPISDLNCNPMNRTAGIITYIPNSTSKKHVSGTLALLTCPLGQKIIDGAPYSICRDGDWSIKLGSCKEAMLKIF
ncbi:unnamed protein product [Onchocerca ochengi]|uniref:Sushi domain-containing protein n=1 Tax=Onchocerca ochengi TaxID=42157 RepID=A0A182ENX3_ONCOC|nr:unnamed protein product [Onchocerca ochengi]